MKIALVIVLGLLLGAALWVLLDDSDDVPEGERFPFFIERKPAVPRGRHEIHGEVRLPGDLPLPGDTVSPHAMVDLDRWGEFVYDRLTGTGIGVDRSGRFHFTDLPAGRYRLRVNVWIDERQYAAESEADAGDWKVALNLAPVPDGSRQGSRLVYLVDTEGRRVPRGKYRGHYSGGSSRRGEFRSEPEKWDLSGRRSLTWIEVFEAVDEDGAALGAVLAGPWPARTGIHRVVLPPERFVSGVVRGPDGRGVPGVKLRARFVDPGIVDLSECDRAPGFVASTETRADGSFTLGGLGPGLFLVEFEAPADTGRVARLVVRAGDGDVRVSLSLAGAGPAVPEPEPPIVFGEDEIPEFLRGRTGDDPPEGDDVRSMLSLRVVDWPEGEKAVAAIEFVKGGWLEKTGFFTTGREVGKNGEIVYRDLRPDSVVNLWVAAIGDGRIVWREGLRPGPGTQGVKLEPGRPVAGRFEGPEGTEVLSLHARRGIVDVEGEIADDGTFGIAGLPAGTVTLTADAFADGTWLVGIAQARTGEAAVVSLAAQPGDVRNIRLPPDPTGDDVLRHLLRLREVARRDPGRRRACLEKLTAVGPKLALVVLDDACSRTVPPPGFVVEALVRLLDDRRKDLVLTLLPRHAWLMTVADRRGW